ncbi:PucR family transcriptional regulator [Clostridium ljungdahlii]|uniref:PucR family transcriptional regulator n=1 Tax=Clostridium ljungdahlii TaxID=1538 RepID=UPI00386FF70D
MLNILIEFLKNKVICEYYILKEYPYDDNFLSTVFTDDCDNNDDIQPNSLYILNLKTFDLTKDNIIKTLTKLSNKNITLILFSNKEDNIINKNISNIFVQYEKGLKISIIYIVTNEPVSKIINLLLLQINQSYLNELNRIKKIYDAFSYISLKELGLQAILDYFKKSIGNPVAVFDIDNKCIASTDKYLDKYFKIKSSAIRNDFHNLYYFAQAVQISNNSSNKEISEIFFPITVQNNVKAYICIFEINKKLKDTDYFTLEVATTATLIEMKKHIAMKTIEERFINDLIYDLINNKVTDEKMLLERFSLIGLNIKGKYSVILLDIISSSKTKLKNPNLKHEDIYDKIFKLASRKIQHKNHHCIIGKLSNTVITLWSMDEQDVEITLASIKDIFNSIQKKIIEEYEDIKVVSGIGKPVDNLKLIYKSYREAKDAIALGSTIYSKNAIISFKDLGVLRLVSKVDDRDSLLEIIPKELINLKKHDEKYNTQLLETLRIYLENNGNASKAAHVLFVHYKTILYRLEKINKICNIDLENYYNRLELEIGLELIKVLSYNNIPVK